MGWEVYQRFSETFTNYGQITESIALMEGSYHPIALHFAQLRLFD